MLSLCVLVKHIRAGYVNINLTVANFTLCVWFFALQGEKPYTKTESTMLPQAKTALP
jgi:hypothetical protein